MSQPSTALSTTTGIVLLAKYPAHGMAKTRLQPALGVEGAAIIARRLLLHSITQAIETHFTLNLCVSPAPNDPCWQTIAVDNSVQWSAQINGDLGERLIHTSQQQLNQYDQIMLIGADCPSLTSERLQNAAARLQDHDSVMIPATDGGYVLLGLKRFNASLFTDMPWSTDQVATITRERIAALGWTLAECEPLHDIDEPCDLNHLPSDWDVDGLRI